MSLGTPEPTTVYDIKNHYHYIVISVDGVIIISDIFWPQRIENGRNSFLSGANTTIRVFLAVAINIAYGVHGLDNIRSLAVLKKKK